MPELPGIAALPASSCPGHGEGSGHAENPPQETHRAAMLADLIDSTSKAGLCFAEEFSHVANEQVGCLEGGEVPSPVEAVPADHVMVAFG